MIIQSTVIAIMKKLNIEIDQQEEKDYKRQENKISQKSNKNQRLRNIKSLQGQGIKML